MRKAFIETVRRKNQSAVRHKVKNEVPYKFLTYAERFFPEHKTAERYIFKAGKYIKENYISEPTTSQFIKETGFQIIAFHGVRKFASAVLQSYYHGDWGETKEKSVRRVSKRLGKFKLYKDEKIKIYALESELSEISKNLREIGSKKILSHDDIINKTALEDRQEEIENRLTANIAHETDDELMIRATRWLNSLV